MTKLPSYPSGWAWIESWAWARARARVRQWRSAKVCVGMDREVDEGEATEGETVLPRSVSTNEDFRGILSIKNRI